MTAMDILILADLYAKPPPCYVELTFKVAYEFASGLMLCHTNESEQG